MLESLLQQMQRVVAKHVMIGLETVPALVLLTVVNCFACHLEWTKYRLAFKLIVLTLLTIVTLACLMNVQLGLMRILDHEHSVPAESALITTSELRMNPPNKHSSFRSWFGC